MPQIVVEDLVKRFQVAERRPGIWGAIRGVVRRELRSVEALAGIGFTIEPGELVILLTNGIRQARSEAKALFGDERTFQVIHDHFQESARSILASLQKAVREHCRPRQPADDFTAIIIKSV